jgi:hypothetical protein
MYGNPKNWVPFIIKRAQRKHKPGTCAECISAAAGVVVGCKHAVVHDVSWELTRALERR